MMKKKMNSLLFSFADFRLPGRRIRRIISHFEPFVKYFFRIGKNFFDPSVRRIPSDYIIFFRVCQVKSSSSRKIFCQDESAFIVKFFTEKIFRFFDPTGSGRVCQVFFSEAAKNFLSSIFSKKKKKK